MKRNEIATLGGGAPGERLVVALEGPDGWGRSHVILAEQNHAEGIGWFDQRTLRLDPHQWGQLRGLLATVDRQVARVASHDLPATIAFPTRFGPDGDDEALNQHVG